MSKYVIFGIMLVISATMYRFADGYFMEKRLRFAVWDAIDPKSNEDDALRTNILAQITKLKVNVVPEEIVFTTDEEPGTVDPSGILQVVIRSKTVSFPYIYRKFGGEKKGVVTVRREIATKGMVATEVAPSP